MHASTKLTLLGGLMYGARAPLTATTFTQGQMRGEHVWAEAMEEHRSNSKNTKNVKAKTSNERQHTVGMSALTGKGSV
jgi:hypothetical protein